MTDTQKDLDLLQKLLKDFIQINTGLPNIEGRLEAP